MNKIDQEKQQSEKEVLDPIIFLNDIFIVLLAFSD